ncbi:MAG: isochorismatase family protein [Gammaproteobacteria bacterium]|nr:isochorismatase family protein [Gammaproteobacteria bacterium]
MDLERQGLGLGNKPAIVVVDVVNGFTSSQCPLGSDCPDVVQANRELLDAFREKQLPVFFTTVIYHDESQAKVFRHRLPALNVLTPESDWVKVDPALAKRSNEVLIEKRWASGFFGTDLNQELTQRNVDSLVITGLTTSGCVRATVLDGMQNEFPVVVPKEAVGDRNIDAHKANLHDMNAKYADVVFVSDVTTHLSNL